MGMVLMKLFKYVLSYILGALSVVILEIIFHKEFLGFLFKVFFTE